MTEVMTTTKKNSKVADDRFDRSPEHGAMSQSFETMLASELVLRRDWDRPEEDAAWAILARRKGSRMSSITINPQDEEVGKAGRDS